MKRFSVQFFCILLTLGLAVETQSQAILPTFWNFDDNQPIGWSESLNTNGLTRYTAEGYFVSAPSACKLDGTGEYVLIEFAEEPGPVSYSIRSSNAPFTGTFTVQESADAATWMALRTFNDSDLNTSHATFTDLPQSNSRFIRFYFTNKLPGSNIALDDVSIASSQAGESQEINITDGINNIPSGFTHFIGQNFQSSIFIQNLGSSANLNITDVEISGPNAAEFSIGFTPFSIAANSDETIQLNFSPTFTGSHFCTLNITSNDASEPNYLINIYAISGGIATEPAAQGSLLSCSNIRSWDFQTSLTAPANPAEGYIVLRKKDAPVSEAPIDNTTYTVGQWIGGSQVVYLGSPGNFDARSIEAGFTYHLAAFAFNGPLGFENYLTSNPVTTTAATPAPNFGSLYNAINPNSATFVSSLTTLMNPSNYFQIYYSNYINTLINNFYVRDTVVSGTRKNMVECQYSGVPFIFDNAFFWTGLSREHNYPQSWMPTFFSPGFDDSAPVSDLHNLTPVWQDNVNAIRSNYPYGEVVNATSTYQQCKLGTNNLGQTVYEMRDSFKGNAARAIMYHATKNNTATSNFSLPEQISLIIPYGQNEHLLKQWHFQDLPDSWEVTRNEYIQYEQHNRNAFIDQITYPCYIRFADLTPFTPEFTYNATTLTCIDPALSYQWYLDGNPIEGATSATYNFTTTGNYSVQVQQFNECPSFTSNSSLVTINVEENEAIQFDLSVFPNPSEGRVVVKTHASRPTAAQLNVLDMTGKIVFTSNENLNGGLNLIAIEEELSAGVYTVEIRSGESAQTTRLVIR
jgi:hypothetical protein